MMPSAFQFMVVGAALSFTVGGIFMKLAEGLTRPWPTAALLAFFALGACLQTLAMRNEELGVTYIVILGVEALLAFAFGAFFFSESVTALRVAGIAAICAGIVALRY